MSKYDYDLFVIGAGSGGVRAARLAGQAGKRVAIAEEYRIGGTCVIRGCIPKKYLVHASEFSELFHDAKGYGWTVEWASFDWPTLRDNVQAEVARLSGIYETNLKRANVEVFEDRAALVGPQAIKLTRQEKPITVEKILVSTGGRASRLMGLKGEELAITSNEAFLLKELPQSILIVGAGYIAVEFATIFSGLGVETTLVYRGDKILRGFDDDIRTHVQANLQRTGVNVITLATLTEISDAGDARLVTLSNGMRIEAAQVMFATGREPNTEGLGLIEAGVQLTERGAVAVDQYSRTNVLSVFALGDVTDRLNLTPVAIREAVAFAETEFYGRPLSFDHRDVPTAVFGRPHVGAVGLTEHEANKLYGDVDVYKTSFRPMKNIIAGNESRTLMKLIVHPQDQRVLGVHIAGPEGPELAQLAAIAVKAGLTKQQWDMTCALHPTAAEELVLMREKS
ncbi:MAG: glutathione-disulfide reductase [Caulobacterales bacterium]